MPYILVDSELVQHFLADESAYRSYVKAKKLKMSNMLELIGIGRELENPPTFKYKHMLRQNVVWMKCEDFNEAVPLVGSYSEMYASLKDRHQVTFAYTTFRDLMNGSSETGSIHGKNDTVRWSKVPMPSAVTQLVDGDSLVGLAADELQLPGLKVRPPCTCTCTLARHASAMRARAARTRARARIAC